MRNISALIRFIYFSSFEYLTILVSKKIIVDTQYVADSLSKIKKKQYYVIPQGINNMYFNLKDNPNTLNLLSVGSISLRKGYEYSIQAVYELKKDFPTINYHIIGSVREDHQTYFLSLQELIKEKGLENNVIMTPNLPFDQLIQALEKCNIFIFHSFEESQGIALCEAMAAGKPIVSTNVGGIPYVVDDGVNGKLSSFGDIDTFAQNIRDILLDEKIRTSMSIAGKKIAHKYSWQAIIYEIIKVYNY